jgi:hypothetical protein|tara:strand:- start:949 stop:1311 length:363 start_codon:yes stop_codon:yes gene_type:complete
MGVLKNILTGSAKETVDAVANAVDRFVSTPEEKAEIRSQIEKEISSRWKSDLSSDSWLSKNVRPLTLIVVISFLVIMTFFDGIGLTIVSESWIGLWEITSITVIGGYFAVRTVDKRGRIK